MNRRIRISILGGPFSARTEPWGVRPFILESGTLQMYGGNKITRARLAATAPKGSSTLKLIEPVNWCVGDTIAIATTAKNKSAHLESEEGKIATISDDKLTITLTEPLMWEHKGEPVAQKLGDKELWIGASVGFLSHNIQIDAGDFEGMEKIGSEPSWAVGWQLGVGCESYEGCMTGWPMNEETGKQGFLHIDHVTFKDMGQSLKQQGGVDISGLRGYPGHAKASFISNSAVWRSFGHGFTFTKTKHFTFEGNVVYNTTGDALHMLKGATDNIVKNNLVIMVVKSHSC